MTPGYEGFCKGSTTLSIQTKAEMRPDRVEVNGIVYEPRVVERTKLPDGYRWDGDRIRHADGRCWSVVACEVATQFNSTHRMWTVPVLVVAAFRAEGLL